MRDALAPTVLAAGIPVSSIATQSTIVVSGGGGALNAAVQQASSGDRLIVRAARYQALLADRGLTIDCGAGFQFDADIYSGGPSRIFGVPAGQSLRLRGGEIVASGLFTRVEISQCAGIVTWIAPRFQFAALPASTAIDRFIATRHIHGDRHPRRQPSGIELQPWHTTSARHLVAGCGADDHRGRPGDGGAGFGRPVLRDRRPPQPRAPRSERPASPLFDVLTIPAGSTSTLSRYLMPPLRAAVPVVLQPIRLGRTGELGLGTPSRVKVN